jgi:cyclophilin family peptidyl-prolyl cis-trans isomerase/HEAT repeat protein
VERITPRIYNFSVKRLFFLTLAAGACSWSGRGTLPSPDAVFARGQRVLDADEPARVQAAEFLKPFVSAGDPALRLAAVEALGKTGGPGVASLLLRSLKEEDPAVRGEAALALFRLRYLKRVPEYSTATVGGLLGALKDSHPGVRWKAAYAFSRWAEPRAEAALAEAVADSEPYVRFFALRSLGQLKDKAPREPVLRSLRDPDASVRREAAWALGEGGWTADLAIAVQDSSPHVRAAAAGGGAAVSPGDPSPIVRALAGDPRLRRKDPHWFVRAGAFRALGELSGTGAMLQEGLTDPDPRAASAALEAVAKSTQPWVERAIESLLRDPKAPLEMLGAAVEASGERKSARLREALRLALDYPQAKASAEVRESILKALKESSDLRQVYWGEGTAPRLAPAAVVLVTEKGEIEIGLAVEEAPVHSQRFLLSVSSGLYDGTIWHRVVSNFVIQGGDPRGSGWGDAGFTLRDEINRLRFERGTVGMPKAGKDTGGCQVFITHVPTPHLDGRYTAFGRVLRGLDVVDRIEPGDRILRAYVKMLE